MHLLGDELVEQVRACHPSPGRAVSKRQRVGDLFAARTRQTPRERISKKRVSPVGLTRAVHRGPVRSVRDVSDRGAALAHRSTSAQICRTEAGPVLGHLLQATRYSVRNACIGSIVAAGQAGNTQAIAATRRRRRAAASRVSGSRELPPAQGTTMRFRTTLSPKPTVIPAPSVAAVLPRTNRTTLA